MLGGADKSLPPFWPLFSLTPTPPPPPPQATSEPSAIDTHTIIIFLSELNICLEVQRTSLCSRVYFGLAAQTSGQPWFHIFLTLSAWHFSEAMYVVAIDTQADHIFLMASYHRRLDDSALGRQTSGSCVHGPWPSLPFGGNSTNSPMPPPALKAWMMRATLAGAGLGSVRFRTKLPSRPRPN